MPDFTKRVRKGIASDLEPGEAVLKALSGQPPGSLTRGMNEKFNVGYGILKGRREKRRHEATEVGLAARIPPRNVYLTLTDRRLLVHTHSKLGVPEDLVAGFSLDQIASIDLDSGRFGSGNIVVAFEDESSVDLLIVSRQRPVEFIDAWGEVRRH